MKPFFALFLRLSRSRTSTVSVRLGGAVLFLIAALPARAQQAQAPPPGTCEYASDSRLRVDPSTFVGAHDPVLGSPDADLVLVEFFDPNCPHCARFHPIMKQVMQENGARAQLYMYPFPLWKYSVVQIEAMLLAAREGKYYDMIDRQMQHRYRGGTSIARLGLMADSLGLDRAAFVRALKAHRMRPEVIERARRARRAGVKQTPTLAIGKRVVAPASRSVECIDQLIERKLATQE